MRKNSKSLRGEKKLKAKLYEDKKKISNLSFISTTELIFIKKYVVGFKEKEIQ